MIQFKTIRDMIFKEAPSHPSDRMFSIKGHLQIFETGLDGQKTRIFNDHNIICTEGKGALMDWLSGVAMAYVPTEMNAMILCNNSDVEASTDTFTSAVSGNISDEGVLHFGAGGNVSVSHAQGDTEISLAGTIPQSAGNDPGNNHIRSVCVVMGASVSTGGPSEGSYLPTTNERLFARVTVGDLVKTVEKTYTFDWIFTVAS